jgi:arylsulfatase A-like enzyme
MPSETSDPDNSINSHHATPNIVLILIDDLGKEWISCYGAQDIVTPNIDALAEEGLKFNAAYCMPQCTPSRVTLLTGQYPFRHGWVNHWDVPRWGGGAHFDESINPSLGIEMKKLGYRTCIAGKWQIDDFRVEPKALLNNGFEDFCMWTGYETGVPSSGERYWDPYLFTKDGSRTYTGQFGPDVFRSFIDKFIRENRNHPFFVYYPMVLTHTPLITTPDDLETLATDLEKHKAMVRYTDKIVGQLLATLDELSLRNNTMVILTTDNGSTRAITGNRNGVEVKGAKSMTSEAGVCIPFIVSWPGSLAKPGETEALIDFTDLFPTLIEAAGGDYKSSKYKIDGQSFYPLLTASENYKPRKWIMSMGGGNQARLTNNGVENQYVFRDRVIRNQRYKLYIDSQKEAQSLYDLIRDPEEINDILDSLDMGNVSNEIEDLLQAVTSFPDRDNEPRYQPNPPQSWDVEITAESQKWKL